MLNRIILIICVCVIATSCSSNNRKVQTVEPTTFISDPSLMPEGGEIIDFENFALGAVENPFKVSSAKFFSERGLGIASVNQWSANGSYVTENTLLPFSSSNFQSGGYKAISIKFDQPIRAVSLGWFDPNLANNRFQVYDSNGRLLTEGSPSTGKTGGSHAAYVGAVSKKPVISSIRVVPASDKEWYSIDNIHIVK
jgi:hypothetical protein